MTDDDADIGGLIAIIGVQKRPFRGAIAGEIEAGYGVSGRKEGGKKSGKRGEKGGAF